MIKTGWIIILLYICGVTTTKDADAQVPLVIKSDDSFHRFFYYKNSINTISKRRVRHRIRQEVDGVSRMMLL